MVGPLPQEQLAREHFPAKRQVGLVRIAAVRMRRLAQLMRLSYNFIPFLLTQLAKKSTESSMKRWLPPGSVSVVSAVRLGRPKMERTTKAAPHLFPALGRFMQIPLHAQRLE